MSSVHYDGFISYRHNKRDTAVAIEIQHSLEHFHIPSAIKEKYHKDKFERIFRDEEELNTGANLAEKIEDALNNSDYLIIICSEEYMESKWCLLEVETFLKNHDPDHVLCVLSNGEPPTIFPKALLERGEPLACDYRMEFKEARRSQLPKLASTMIGCTYDELVMRQEKYRRKRLLILISIIATLAIIAISYLLYSNARIRENYNNTLKNESKILAKESLNYYDQKDRYNAILKALEALPSEDFDRPITDEAQYALTKAIYAYATPYQYAETWRIDNSNDINEYFVSRDDKYIIYLDNSKTIHTVDIDTHEELCSFKFTPSNISDIHEGKDGQVIACYNGVVYAYDYLSGNKIWETQLKYESFGITHLSNKNDYIAASDTLGLRITDPDGNPQISLDLPEDYDGYITDFVWSKNDDFIALKLRHMSDASQIGIYDMNDYKLTLSDVYEGEIIYFDFDSKDRLHILHDNNVNTTMVSSNNLSIYNNTYQYELYDPKNKLFSVDVTSSFEIFKIKAYALDDLCLLIFGDSIYIVDSNGTIIRNYQVDSPIVSIFAANSEYLDVLCKNGFRGNLWYSDGSAAFSKYFPEDVDDLKMVKNDTMIDSCYILQKDGNLLIYNNLYDENFTFFEDEAFYDDMDENLQFNERSIMKAGSKLFFIDSENKKLVSSIELEQGEYCHLLDMYEDKVFVLYVDQNGQYNIRTYDFEKGTLTSSDKLPLYDFYVSFGYMSYPLSRAEILYLDQYYRGASSLICDDHKLYMHDINDPNTIVVYDLLSKESSKTSFDLDNRGLIEAKVYYYPSALMVKDGRYILSRQIDIDTFEESYVLLDLETKQGTTLEGTPGDDFCAYLDNKRAVVSQEDGIYFYGLNGELLEKIGYDSYRAIYLEYHDDLLYCISPDEVLKIYKDGKEIRRVDVGNVSYYNSKSYRFEFTDDRLYAFALNSLNVINLDSNSTTPVYSIGFGILGYYKDKNEILVFGYDAKKADIRYHLAAIREYTIDELIEEANRQLNNYH